MSNRWSQRCTINASRVEVLRFVVVRNSIVLWGTAQKSEDVFVGAGVVVCCSPFRSTVSVEDFLTIQQQLSFLTIYYYKS